MATYKEAVGYQEGGGQAAVRDSKDMSDLRSRIAGITGVGARR